MWSLILLEQLKLAQLHRLSEELEELGKQEQPGTTAADTEDETNARL